MFDRAVAALKAAEQAIVADLDQLWVPFDPATGSGGLHWHGAGAGALIEGYKSVVGIRASLEAKEPPTPAAESVTPEEAPVTDETAVAPYPAVANTNAADYEITHVTFIPSSGTFQLTPLTNEVVTEPEPVEEAAAEAPAVEPEPESVEPAPAEESVTEVEDGA